MTEASGSRGVQKVKKQMFDILDIRQDNPHKRNAVAFYSPLLALASFPLKSPNLDPGKNVWGRDCGRVRIELQADWERKRNGDIKTDKETGLAKAAFPYGSLPRLAMLWLITEVTKNKQQRVTLGSSIYDFLDKIGYVQTSRNSRNLEKQLHRLFNCQVSLYQADPNGKGFGFQTNRIADELALWWDLKEPANTGLFDSYVLLSERFYKDILSHGYPVDMDIVKLFHSEPMVLDVYMWLSYRMFAINTADKPYFLSWDNLSMHFCNYKNPREFRRHFRNVVRKIEKVWTKLDLDVGRNGMTIRPSALSVPTKSPKLDLGK